jgi:GNAT superfamily N-acetyltransferase
MEYRIRKAELEDAAEVSELIARSVAGLSAEDYSPRQIEMSIQTVFGVDTDLISDGTYFVAESSEGMIVGCGGWSRRKTLYGASRYGESRNPELLDPALDAAKIRAFFVHPDWARRGIGTAILDACEGEARSHGFRSAEMMATLPGVKLYAVRGYIGDEEFQVPLGDGEAITCVKMSKPLV